MPHIAAYSADRKAEHPANHLATFRGRLQADAFPGFNRLYEPGHFMEIACWAHVRRKFHDLYAVHESPIAKEALERIGALYGIEREIRGRPPDERKLVRTQRALPLLEDLKQWFKWWQVADSARQKTVGNYRLVRKEMTTASLVPNGPYI